MNKVLQKEIKKLIKVYRLDCTIEELKDRANWYNISYYQKLSEEFIREFKDKVDWSCISRYQKLSEDFIREFKAKVNWVNISAYQKLSEKFIREFKDNFKKVILQFIMESAPENFKRIETIIQKFEQEEQNKVEKENQILRKNKFKGNAILMLEI